MRGEQVKPTMTFGPHAGRILSAPRFPPQACSLAAVVDIWSEVLLLLFSPGRRCSPVDDVELVDVLEGQRDLRRVEAGAGLGELAQLAQVEEQLAARAVVEHEEQLVLGLCASSAKSQARCMMATVRCALTSVREGDRPSARPAKGQKGR